MSFPLTLQSKFQIFKLLKVRINELTQLTSNYSKILSKRNVSCRFHPLMTFIAETELTFKDKLVNNFQFLSEIIKFGIIIQLIFETLKINIYSKVRLSLARWKSLFITFVSPITFELLIHKNTTYSQLEVDFNNTCVG